MQIVCATPQAAVQVLDILYAAQLQPARNNSVTVTLQRHQGPAARTLPTVRGSSPERLGWFADGHCRCHYCRCIRLLLIGRIHILGNSSGDLDYTVGPLPTIKKNLCH